MVHVSFDLVDEFVPRVPKQRCPGEDETTPRICVAPDIYSALQAIPQSGETIKAMQRLGVPVIVHAYYLKSDSVLYMEQIADKVGDAIATGEMWITEPPTSVYRVDYELTEPIIRSAIDKHGTKGEFFLLATKKRVKYQDNWKNLAHKYSVNSAVEKWFLDNLPDISYRTFMTNMDEETFAMIENL